jgi:hypothetical protein
LGSAWLLIQRSRIYSLELRRRKGYIAVNGLSQRYESTISSTRNENYDTEQCLFCDLPNVYALVVSSRRMHGVVKGQRSHSDRSKRRGDR